MGRLQPAEAFFDALPLSLAEGITGVPGGTTIQWRCLRAAPGFAPRAPSRQIAALGHKPECVKPFVAAHGHPCLPGGFSSMISAASLSVVPLAWNTSASTISPLGFSISRFPQ